MTRSMIVALVLAAGLSACGGKCKEGAGYCHGNTAMVCANGDWIVRQECSAELLVCMTDAAHCPDGACCSCPGTIMPQGGCAL